jgi:hypothetical protein
MNDRIERFRTLCDGFLADTQQVEKERQVDELRRRTQPQVVLFLKKYMAGSVTTEDFRATFDQRTRNDWLGFGLKGMSGAMFLNKLVKHVPDPTALANELKRVLPVPEDEAAGRRQMERFAGFLREIIKTGQAGRGQIQPARMPFFVSVWWHLQDLEKWPIYYVTGRQVLEKEGAFQGTKEPVQDYLAFRSCFLGLAMALRLPSWELEHVLAWQAGKVTPPPPPPATEEYGHAQVQCLLAEIGAKLKCKVWIAANDHAKEWEGKTLGDLSIKSLPPLGLDAGAQDTIRRIDVLWLRGANQVVAAFEVENTTSIYSGLPRLSDLIAQAPNLSFPLYIVAPANRIEKVKRELSRPTFQALDLHERCGFFSNSALVDAAEGILKWANDPSAIDSLASKVPTIADEL